MNLIQRLFHHKETPQTPAQRDFALLNQNICPDCGCTGWLNGPCGGDSQNIECRCCGSDFNVYPSSGPAYLFVERIGWNHSGRLLETAAKNGTLMEASKPNALTHSYSDLGGYESYDDEDTSNKGDGHVG
jgi:hypothetical protein